MKIKIHTLFNDNIHPDIIKFHKKVFSYFGFEPHYTNQQIYPGNWYDHIMKTTSDDMIIFSDIDAVPINSSFYDEMVQYCENNYMIGVTQVTPNCNTVYDF